MEMPLSEIADRFSILILKWIHGADVREELREYSMRCIMDNSFFDLLKINSEIWELESDIRRGKEGTLSLEEVGIRAISIRDKNKERIRIKNEITKYVSNGFPEIKVNHASQD